MPFNGNFNALHDESQVVNRLKKVRDQLRADFLARFNRRNVLQIIKKGIKAGYKVLAVVENQKGDFKKPLWKGKASEYKPVFSRIENQTKKKKFTYGVVLGKQLSDFYLNCLDFDIDYCSETDFEELYNRIKEIFSELEIPFYEETTLSGRKHLFFLSEIELEPLKYVLPCCKKIKSERAFKGEIELLTTDHAITCYSLDKENNLFTAELKPAKEEQVNKLLIALKSILEPLTSDNPVNLLSREAVYRELDLHLRALRELYEAGIVNGFEADLYIVAILLHYGIVQEQEALQFFKEFWGEDYDEKTSLDIFKNALERRENKEPLKTYQQFLDFLVENKLGRDFEAVKELLIHHLETHSAVYSHLDDEYERIAKFILALFYVGVNADEIYKRDKTLYVYNTKESIWLEGNGIIQNFLYRHIIGKRKRSREYVNHILNALGSYTDDLILLKEPPSHLVPCNNGVYDLKEKIFRPFRPEDGFRYKFKWNYNPKAYSKKIDEFLKSLVDSEKDYLTLWEITAYTLYRDYPNHHFFIIFGKGGNGKTTFTNQFLKSLLVDSNGRALTTSNSLDELFKYTFALEDLEGKHLLVFPDEGRSYISKGDFARLKQLTGEESVRINRKYKSAITIQSYAKVIITTNHPPEIEDMHAALFRRLITLHFPHNFTNSGVHIKALFQDEKEMEGAFNTALRYLQALYDNGFIFTKRCTNFRKCAERYKDISNPIRIFLRENVVYDEKAVLPKSELYKAYEEYCDENAFTPKPYHEFTREVKPIFEANNVSENKRKINGRTIMVWEGVRLKDDDDYDEEPTTPVVEVDIDGSSPSTTPVEPAPEPTPEPATALTTTGAPETNSLPELPELPEPTKPAPVKPAQVKSSKKTVKRTTSTRKVKEKEPEICYTKEEIEKALNSYITTDAKAKEVLPKILESDTWYLDLETTSLDPREGKVRLFTIGLNDGSIYIFDFFKLSKEVQEQLISALPSKTVVGHNLKFDLKFLAHHYGLKDFPKIFDTYIASLLLHHAKNPERPKKGELTLENLALKYLSLKLPKELQKSDFTGELTKEQITYAYKDVEVLKGITAKQVEELNSLNSALKKPEILNLHNLVATLEMKFLPIVVELELAGIPVDIGFLNEKLKEYKAVVEEHYNYFARKGVNPNSSSQLLEFLRSQGLDIDSTSKETLTHYKDHDAVAHLLSYRKANKVFKEVEKLLKKAQNGRIYPEFQQVGAISGRMSAKNPNVQQIPREIKANLYKAGHGKAIIKADFPAIELRLASVVAPDKIMQDAFRDGKDLHKLTASVISGKPYDEITKEERQKAKAVNFGLLYGMGAHTLKEYAYMNYGVELTDEEAEEIRNKFFNHYKGLAEWHKRTAERFLKHTAITVSTLLGRKCSANGLTNALNYPVQGSGADLLKLSCVRFRKLVKQHGIDARIINLIHDEIVVECSEKDKEKAKELLKTAMESACNDLMKSFKTEVEIEEISSTENSLPETKTA